MAQSKYQFFSKGVDTQKIPDAVMTLKRPDLIEMQKWTPEQKREAKEWVQQVKASFNRFTEAIENC